MFWRQVILEIQRSPILLAVVGASLLLFAAAGYFAGTTQWLTVPYLVPEARTATQEVRPGERLRMGFRIIRRRVCQIDLDRFITNIDNDTVVYRERVPGGSTPAGDDWVVIEVTVPNIPPGRYGYRTTVTNTCYDGVYVTQTPQVQFQVLPPAEKKL